MRQTDTIQYTARFCLATIGPLSVERQLYDCHHRFESCSPRNSHLDIITGWRKKTVSLGWRKKNSGKNMDRRSLRKRAVKRVSSMFDSFQDELQACGAAENATAMVYARAVWVENGKQMEGVLPLNWIDTETKVVRWPLKNVSVAHKRLLQPQEDWLSFEFVKVKVTSVSRQECEKYNYTSAQTEEEDTVCQKRMKKRRKFEDYVQGSDLSPEEDEPLPDKKKEDTVLLPVPPPKIKLSQKGQKKTMLLELPAPPELANTTVRQPESPAYSEISGCSRPTPHRSPTRSESSEAFSPESARSRRSRTPQRGVRKPSQSGSRKSRASSSIRFSKSLKRSGRANEANSRSRRSRTPQRGVRNPSHSGSRKGRPSSSSSRHSRTPQRGVRNPSHSGSRKGRASSSRSRRSRTPQRGVRNPSQSERGLFPMSQAKYQKSVLGKLVELLDEIKRVGRHYEPLNSAVHVARLETLEDFAEEEARLKDRNLWKQRVSQLSKVGGRNNKDCVHKVMDRLFTNSLMAAFNMKGRGRSEKKAFQDTVFYSVVKVLSRVNIRKAAGPDGIPGRVWRTCAEQLSGVFTDIFNLSLAQAVVPVCLKTTIIVPVPKRSNPECLNDYRPVALTPIITKCLEKLILAHLKPSFPSALDPHQYAYRANRSTEDAISTVLHSALTHLDNSNSYARMLFIDFSSAFNTVIPSDLIMKLHRLGISISICNWILDFLINRPQMVRLNNLFSTTLPLNTGVPQGCVLSPLLYTLFTHDCSPIHNTNSIIKFADDTTVLGLIRDNDESA
ncbi:unnamed protein product [Leuciscus chuanchicus]